MTIGSRDAKMRTGSLTPARWPQSAPSVTVLTTPWPAAPAFTCSPGMATAV